MNSAAEPIELARCKSCQSRFLPTDGPCPRCGSAAVERYSVAGLGKVAAATRLELPGEGWTSPHVLALVELPDAVRLLAIVEGSVPAIGAVVSVRRDGEVYRVRAEPELPTGEARGEGESPRTGTPESSFEPPR